MLRATSRLRHLLRFPLINRAYTELLTEHGITLEHVERIVARLPPPGWEKIAATPVPSGGLGFKLLTDVD